MNAQINANLCLSKAQCCFSYSYLQPPKIDAA
uniref:Uncharacterized protein n=1 Tax=Rhizophora mucronata TaxID=61149 RepID=A0A2P2NQ40_RHIMU